MGKNIDKRIYIIIVAILLCLSLTVVYYGNSKKRFNELKAEEKSVEVNETDVEPEGHEEPIAKDEKINSINKEKEDEGSKETLKNKDKEVFGKKKEEKLEQQKKKSEVKYEVLDKKEVVSFKTIRKENAKLAKGNEKVLREGKNGEVIIRSKYKVVGDNKSLVHSERILSVKPVDKIIEYGTLKVSADSGKLDKGQAHQTLTLVNSERRAQGKKELQWNSSLEGATNIRAKELRKNFSHTRPNGQSWQSVSSIAMAENVAYGYSSPQGVIEGFMNSSGHRANILDDRWSSMSMSLYIVDGVYYWAQLFAE